MPNMIFGLAVCESKLVIFASMRGNTRFIAGRILGSFGHSPKEISSLAVRISVFGVALGLAVILLSFSIILGFKKEVKRKIHGFTSDIVISSLDYATSYASKPLSDTDALLSALGEIECIKHAQAYSTVPGMIKTDSDFEGVILKGLGEGYDTSFLESALVEGDLPRFSDGESGDNGIIVSSSFAAKLSLRTGDEIHAHFFVNSLKTRKLKVTGIYQTNINEHDGLFVITSKELVDRINGWQASQASGIEIILRDVADIDEAIDSISMALRPIEVAGSLAIETPEDIYPDIFSWLDVLDTNVAVILVLMTGLSLFSVISGLLIIILEKVNAIGMLKALGAGDKFVKRVFASISAMIIGKGLLWGNIAGMGLYTVQRVFEPFKLDPAIYYADHVPVHITVWHVIAINLLVIAVAIVATVVPSVMISKVNPSRTIKFD